jgi:hypothetical protein
MNFFWKQAGISRPLKKYSLFTFLKIFLKILDLLMIFFCFVFFFTFLISHDNFVEMQMFFFIISVTNFFILEFYLLKIDIKLLDMKDNYLFSFCLVIEFEAYQSNDIFNIKVLVWYYFYFNYLHLTILLDFYFCLESSNKIKLLQ